MLFNFPNYLLLLISNFIPLWSENILNISLLFKFIEAYFMSWLIVWPRECSIYTWEDCVFILLLLSRVFYKCLLGLRVYNVQFFCFFVTFCLIILSIIEHGILKLPTITVELSIFPSILFGFPSCILIMSSWHCLYSADLPWLVPSLPSAFIENWC